MALRGNMSVFTSIGAAVNLMQMQSTTNPTVHSSTRSLLYLSSQCTSSPQHSGICVRLSLQSNSKTSKCRCSSLGCMRCSYWLKLSSLCWLFMFWLETTMERQTRTKWRAILSRLFVLRSWFNRWPTLCFVGSFATSCTTHRNCLAPIWMRFRKAAKSSINL